MHLSSLGVLHGEHSVWHILGARQYLLIERDDFVEEAAFDGRL